jgi:hypothetical protein
VDSGNAGLGCYVLRQILFAMFIVLKDLPVEQPREVQLQLGYRLVLEPLPPQCVWCLSRGKLQIDGSFSG